MQLLWNLIFLVVFTGIFIPVSSARPLIVSFGTHNMEPYIFAENNEVTGGIIPDIMEAFGKKAGLPIVYRNTSRKREESYLQNGKRDVVVITSPAWFADRDACNWSIPLFQEMDWFVVSARNAFPIESFDDLDGKRLGTITGFYYAGLMEKFGRGEILRDDTVNLYSNFRMLEKGRVDCLIDSDIQIKYFLKKNNASADFVIARKVASIHDIQSAFSKQAPVTIEQVNRIYRELKEEGEIEKILRKYE